MINGVMHIVAAVLFAMVYLFGNMGIMWLWIGAVYLVLGICNLIGVSIRNSKKQKEAARKAEEAQKAEAAKSEEFAAI